MPSDRRRRVKMSKKYKLLLDPPPATGELSLSLLSRFFESETKCLLLIMVPACSYQTTSTSFDFFSIKVEANSFLFRWRMQKRKEIGKDPKIKPRMDEFILISVMNIISFFPLVSL